MSTQNAARSVFRIIVALLFLWSTSFLISKALPDGVDDRLEKYARVVQTKALGERLFVVASLLLVIPFAYKAYYRRRATHTKLNTSPTVNDVPRTIAQMMAAAYETASIRWCVILFLSLVVAIPAFTNPSGQLIILGLVIGSLYVLAVVKQVVLAWRIAHNLYGSTEHEVRELMSYILSRPDVTEFTDGGSTMPAFDLAATQTTVPVPDARSLPEAR